MNKKAKKAARELQRLQSLYQSATENRPIGVSQVATAKTSDVGQPTVSVHHGYVKRDLLVLFSLLVVMVAALIGLNLLAENTAFGEVLAGWVGRLF